MKKRGIYILRAILVLGVLLAPFSFSVDFIGLTPVIDAVPHFAQANVVVDAITDRILPEGINGVFALLNLIAYTLFTITSFFVYIAGMIFNFAVFITISQMNTLLPHEVIDNSWSLIRDMINTIFVFILLYAGIRTIFGNYGTSIQKLIINTVLAAVFVNFSLFFTKALVDGSNILSLAIYNNTIQQTVVTQNQERALDNNARNRTNFSLDNDSTLREKIDAYFSDTYGRSGGLAGSFVEAMKSTKILEANRSSGNAAAQQAQANAQIFFKQLIGIFSLGIAALLLLLSGLMFLFRYVFIILLLIGSPIYFAGWILPKAKQISNTWVKHLITNIAFPPVYFLLIYISLQIIKPLNTESAKLVRDLGEKSALIGGGAQPWVISSIEIVFASVFSLLLLGLPLIISTVLGTKIAGFSVVENSVNSFKNATRGYIGRNTIGRAANAVRNSETVKRSPLLQNTLLGKNLQGVVANVADKKFGGKRTYVGTQKEKEDMQAAFTKSQAKTKDFGTLTNNLQRRLKDKDIIAGIGNPTEEDKREAIAREAESQKILKALSVDEILAQRDAIKTNITNKSENIPDETLATLKGSDNPNARALLKEIHDGRLQAIRDEMSSATPDKAALGAAVKALPSHTSMAELSIEEMQKLTQIAGAEIKGKPFEAMVKNIDAGTKEVLDDLLVTQISNNISDVIDDKDNYSTTSEGLSKGAREKLNQAIAEYYVAHAENMISNSDVFNIIKKDKKVSASTINGQLAKDAFKTALQKHLSSTPTDINKVDSKMFRTLDQAILSNSDVVSEMTTGQVKILGDIITDSQTLKEIGRDIMGNSDHVAHDYIMKAPQAVMFRDREDYF